VRVEHRNDGSKLDGEALVAVNLSLKELLLFEAAKTELPVPPRGEARRRIAPFMREVWGCRHP
jgi:hypothetical protein